jgi:hypothetical protein
MFVFRWVLVNGLVITGTALGSIDPSSAVPVDLTGVIVVQDQGDDPDMDGREGVPPDSVGSGTRFSLERLPQIGRFGKTRGSGRWMIVVDGKDYMRFEGTIEDLNTQVNLLARQNPGVWITTREL